MTEAKGAISARPPDSLIASAIGVVTLAIYSLGACRTIYVGDSGELVAATHLLGIPHPTGYPLYVLIGKLWTLVLPVGSIAFRMSLFSATSAAATVALLFRAVRRLGGSLPAATFAALLLAFTPSFWGEANIQRVYALNALFVAGALLLVVRWQGSRSPRDLAWLFFACGLGAANHTVMVAVAAAAALALLLHQPRLALAGKTLLVATAATAAGLLPYLYLPLRSRANPPLDSGNPESLQAFLDVVLRRDFWHRKWLESWADLVPIGGDFIAALGAETLWIGLLFAVAGVWARSDSPSAPPAGRGKRPRHSQRHDPGRPARTFLLLVLVVNVLALATHGSSEDLFVWHRYYIPALLCLAVLAGLGVDRLATRYPRWRWLALALPVVLLVNGFARVDRSAYALADDYGRTLLESLPERSTLVAADDNILFILIYLHRVEGVRPDVELVTPGVAGSAPAALDINPSRRTVLFTHPPGEQLEGIQFVPVGLAFQAASTAGPLPQVLVDKATLAGEHDPAVPKDYLTRQLLGDFHLMRGTTLRRESWVAAKRELELAAATAPEHFGLHYNLGLTYVSCGLFDEAIRAFRIADAIAPRGFPRADGGRARPRDRIREVESERERIRALERQLLASARVGDLRPATAEYHWAMASALAEGGERLAALGHQLRAEELEAER